MTNLLVETPSGALVRKSRAALRPGDMLVFDGPDAHASIERMQRELDDEIAAAGGLDAWRATSPAPVKRAA